MHRLDVLQAQRRQVNPVFRQLSDKFKLKANKKKMICSDGMKHGHSCSSSLDADGKLWKLTCSCRDSRSKHHGVSRHEEHCAFDTHTYYTLLHLNVYRLRFYKFISYKLLINYLITDCGLINRTWGCQLQNKYKKNVSWMRIIWAEKSISKLRN